MLVEEKVCCLYKVDDLDIDGMRNHCLTDFASRLNSLLRTWDGKGGTWNYKTYNDNFAHLIKYNSKNIVFEETIHNNDDFWSVEGTCASCYGLSKLENAVPKYEFNKDNVRMYMEECVCEKGEPDNPSVSTMENLVRFNEYFGKGEFPFMTITIIRIGNVDHYFYRIHR